MSLWATRWAMACFSLTAKIGRVPRLAICKDKDSGLFTLYYCDDDWNLLGVATDYQTVDAAKRRAERIYPGSFTRWINKS